MLNGYSPLSVQPSGSAATVSPWDSSGAVATTLYVDRLFNGIGQTWFEDDFVTGGGSSAITTATNFTGGDMSGWNVVQISGGTQSAQGTNGTYSNPGQLLITTSAISGQGLSLYRGSSSAASVGALGSNSGWDYNCVIKLGSTSNIAIRVGFTSAGQQAVDTPSNGIWVRYDTAAADTQFTFESRSGGVSTTSVTNSKNADTNFHAFRIRSTVAGTLRFSVDGGTETSIATNVPSAALLPVIQVITRTAGAATATLDVISYSGITSRS